MDYPSWDNPGENISVGLIDSLYELPQNRSEKAYQEGNIGQKIDYVDSDKPYTTPHGIRILDILHFMASEARYNLYRVTSEDNRKKPSDIVDALGEARKDCDIVSLSIGQPESFALRKSAEKVVESGTVVVAAAGNRDGRSRSIRCPANVEGVLSVGSVVAECRADMGNSNTGLYRDYPATTYPPGSYWVKKRKKDEEYWENFPISFVEGPFCGGGGCSPVHECSENRHEREWEGNVDETPDVLAPHHRVDLFSDQNDEPVSVINYGTSFATPVVAGGLAGILGKLFEQGIQPTPTEVTQAVHDMGDEIDEGRGRRFNARRT